MYAPRPYRSPALVFIEKGCDDAERYWLSVLTGNVEVHRLAAGHRKVIAAPHLEAWLDVCGTGSSDSADTPARAETTARRPRRGRRSRARG
jgi:hypothetical protein